MWGEPWGWGLWQHCGGGCAVVGLVLGAVQGCPGSQEATAQQQTVHPRAQPVHLPAQLLPQGWQQAGLCAVSHWGILIREVWGSEGVPGRASFPLLGAFGAKVLIL